MLIASVMAMVMLQLMFHDDYGAVGTSGSVRGRPGARKDSEGKDSSPADIPSFGNVSCEGVRHQKSYECGDSNRGGMVMV